MIDNEKFLKNRQAYLKMKPELLEKYAGQFAAFYEEEFIAVNPDKTELIKEVKKICGSVRALIQHITKDEPQIRLSVCRRFSAIIK